MKLKPEFFPVPHCRCFSSSLTHTKDYSVLQSRIVKLDWVVLIIYTFPSFFSSDPYQACYIEYITDLRPMTIGRILPKFRAMLTVSMKTTTKMNDGEIQAKIRDELLQHPELINLGFKLHWEANTLCSIAPCCSIPIASIQKRMTAILLVFWFLICIKLSAVR